MKFGLRDYKKLGLENSLNHVFRHTSDDLTKSYHGIFDKKGSALITELDNLYNGVKSVSWDLSKKEETIGTFTRKVLDNGNVNYIIDMGKKIGKDGSKGSG